MIEVNNLTKRYGNHVAVDHLSFQVKKGQIYGFLGPNGAGKSTTMNIMTGYMAATEGEVLINGKNIEKDPEEAKKSIGYLPEIPPLYVDMTVQEYLTFVAQLKKVSKKEVAGQLAEVMEMTGILDMKNRLIKNLSKGYRQRVGFAQALLGSPEVIILDEPMVGLDPKQIIEIRDLIKKLGETHTIILSSHILSEISAVCDHIMIISHGKLVASDSPQNLKKLMNGEARLEMEVKGDFEDIKKALSSLESVESVEEIGLAQNTVEDTAQKEEKDSMETKSLGSCRIVVLSKDKADVREQVFYALAEAKLPIMSMSYVEKSLEEIFLELTEEDK